MEIMRGAGKGYLRARLRDRSLEPRRAQAGKKRPILIEDANKNVKKITLHSVAMSFVSY